jgi:hypothetical protein
MAISAESSASRTVVRASGAAGSLELEPAALLGVLQRAGDVVELARQHLLEVVDREAVDAVVGHAALREVVGADLLRSLAGPDLGAAVGRQLGLLLRELEVVQPCAQHLHRTLAVLQLRLLVLHRDHQAGRLVGDAHGRVGRVDGLAAGAGRAVHVDLEVVRIDLDLDLLGLRQHRHGGGGGVDAALRLGGRHALHAVRATLVLEPRERAVAAHLEGVRAVGGVQRLGLEAEPLGVPGEHPVQVAGPQARLVPAGSRADLDDHVLLVVRVGLDHREPDLLLEHVDPLAGGAQLIPQLVVVGALVEELLRALGVGGRAAPFLGQPRGRRELVELPPGLGVALPIADYRGVRHLRLHLGVARLDLLDERLDHAIESTILSSPWLDRISVSRRRFR